MLPTEDVAPGLPSVTVVNRAVKFESKFIANCYNMLLLQLV